MIHYLGFPLSGVFDVVRNVINTVLIVHTHRCTWRGRHCYITRLALFDMELNRMKFEPREKQEVGPQSGSTMSSMPQLN